MKVGVMDGHLREVEDEMVSDAIGDPHFRSIGPRQGRERIDAESVLRPVISGVASMRTRVLDQSLLAARVVDASNCCTVRPGP